MSVEVGDQVQASQGLWAPNPTGYTYQWQESVNGSTGWVDVVGATRSDYIFVDADEGMWFRVAVSAENVAGESDVTYSEPVGPVGEFVGVPTLVNPPVVLGSVVAGQSLSSSTGTWIGSPTSYAYQWQSSEDGVTWEDIVGATDESYTVPAEDVGIYFRVGVVAVNDQGSSEIAYSEAAGPAESPPIPSEDPMAPCTPWITGDDVADCCSVETTSSVIFDAVATMASDLLFSISGRLFAGECSRTVRPACDECYCGWQILSRGYVVGPWDYGYPLMLCDNCLLACDPSLVKLAGTPIREITEVKIDGDVVDPADYRIFNDRYLQRLDGGRWPHSQNLGWPDTEDNTFSITYSFGADPPALGVAAAAQIGCELYKACSTGAGECQLPTGVTRLTRQGVTIDKLAFTSWGYRDGRWTTGLALVDAFLASVNPSGLQRRPTVWAPGKRQYAQPWG